MAKPIPVRATIPIADSWCKHSTIMMLVFEIDMFGNCDNVRTGNARHKSSSSDIEKNTVLHIDTVGIACSVDQIPPCNDKIPFQKQQTNEKRIPLSLRRSF